MRKQEISVVLQPDFLRKSLDFPSRGCYALFVRLTVQLVARR